MTSQSEEKPTFNHPQTQGAQPYSPSFLDPSQGNSVIVSDVPDITDLHNRIAELERKTQRLDTPWELKNDIQGLFETVSAVPTTVPKGIFDQIKIYVNGATLRFYWYDNVANTWHYVTATA